MKMFSWVRLRLMPIAALGFWGLLFQASCSLGESEYIHKYRDAQGVWRFSDRPPQTDRAVESREAIASAPRQKVRLYRKAGQAVETVIGVNDYFGPVEVSVKFLALQNVVISDEEGGSPPDTDRIRNYILAGSQQSALFVIQPKNSRKSWRYKYQYRYVPGDPRAAADAHFAYQLPFRGGPYPVTQGFRGKSSHRDPHNRYAVDIAMPVGTPILCARSGIVMETMGDYFWAGKNLAYYGPRSNLVRVVHDDGTMGLYAHIQRGSLTVTPGQRVAAGEMIARSGNTGYSSGPHLHFAVLVNQGMEVVSLPFKFADPGGPGVIPVQGMNLFAGE